MTMLSIAFRVAVETYNRKSKQNGSMCEITITVAKYLRENALSTGKGFFDSWLPSMIPLLRDCYCTH